MILHTAGAALPALFQLVRVFVAPLRGRVLGLPGLSCAGIRPSFSVLRGGPLLPVVPQAGSFSSEPPRSTVSMLYSLAGLSVVLALFRLALCFAGE